MKALRFPDMPDSLSNFERLMYRDRLRAARYAALADAEGFAQICYELEALGVRLLGRQEGLGMYRESIRREIAIHSLVFDFMSIAAPGFFKGFHALYAIVLKARNDNMHLGAYARHATKAAIELCIGLEEGLMNGISMKVADVMVSEVVALDPNQPVAHARQLMLMHSFSFLPIYLGCNWYLLSEIAVAKYLSAAMNSNEKKERLGASIESAVSKNSLKLTELSDTDFLTLDMDVKLALDSCDMSNKPTLWLVPDVLMPNKLLGVLSPFELM